MLIAVMFAWVCNNNTTTGGPERELGFCSARSATLKAAENGLKEYVLAIDLKKSKKSQFQTHVNSKYIYKSLEILVDGMLRKTI